MAFVVVLLTVLSIVIIVLALETTAFKSCSSSSRAFTAPIIEMDDGNQYDFGTRICEGYRDLWEDPSIPLSDRNLIGRAIFQTADKIKETMQLIRTGKRYDLGRNYSPQMPFGFGRYLSTQLFCGYSGGAVVSCTQGVYTNALGNIGTQFDYFPHFFLVDTDRHNETDFPSNAHLILFNNIRGDQVFHNFTGDGDRGVQHFGADKLPLFFTQAILVDIAGYKEVDILPAHYGITAQDFLNALAAQALQLSDIGAGDAVLIYTGWGKHYDSDPALFMDVAMTPGLTAEVVLDILFDTNAAIIGSDTWGVDQMALPVLGGHEYFITCGGGFLHESLQLDEWVTDARNGEAPWTGAYIYQPLPIEGSVASAGKPVVLV